MPTRSPRVPGPDHPIAIEPSPERVTVTVGGRVVADSVRALRLREADYPPVRYVPRADVDLPALRRTDTITHCPYKGDASYWGVPDADGRVVDVAWSYEVPFPAVAAIAGHLAFYPDRVDAIALGEPEG